VALTSTRLLLDTSAYRWLREGHVQVVAAVSQAVTVILSVVSMGELEAGFRLGSRVEANRQSLADFCAEPFVMVAPVTADVAGVYARIFADLRRAGTQIPTNDIWIAATAIDAGAQVLTFDRDFDQVAGLDRVVLTTPT
jgi:tRNA(fMet)-specific endonuclease VapC